MGKILEKLMKKYWKNAKNTGKVYEKILEECKKKTGKVREIRQSKKVGTMNFILSDISYCKMHVIMNLIHFGSQISRS